MKFILGQKLEMTQKFLPDGKVIPVTKIVAGPCVVIQIKTQKRDDYSAVQIGFGQTKKINKPLKGHLGDLGKFKYLREFRIKEEDKEKLKVGDRLLVKIFTPGDIVQASGISKGKGFQGVVKRWGFAGGPASHGHKDQLRMPGSIGASSFPSKVFKGKKMAGRMGSKGVTVKNLKVIEVDPKNNLMFIKGALPGSRGSLVLISGAGEINLPSAEIKREGLKIENKKED